MIVTLAALAAAHPLSPITVDVWPDRTVLSVAPGPADAAEVALAGCAAQPPTEDVALGLIRREVRWTCPSSPRSIRVSGDAGLPVVLRVHGPDGVVRRRLAEGETPLNPEESALGWLRAGVEHLVAGGDHLAVVALLVLRRQTGWWWSLSAFTLGHALSLSAAVLGGWALPSGPVELAIAASVVALAVDVVAPRGPPTAWPLVVVGWAHGLGFAGALSAAAGPVGAVELGAFHLGLEAVQLALAAVVARVAGRVPSTAVATALGSLGVWWVLLGLG